MWVRRPLRTIRRVAPARAHRRARATARSSIDTSLWRWDSRLAASIGRSPPRTLRQRKTRNDEASVDGRLSDRTRIIMCSAHSYAGVAELADAGDSKSPDLRVISVRPRAPAFPSTCSQDIMRGVVTDTPLE